MRTSSPIKKTAKKTAKKSPKRGDQSIGPPPKNRLWVNLLSSSLFIAIIAILFSFLFYFQRGADEGFFASQELDNLLQSDLVNLQIMGQNQNRHPYILTAKRAKPDSDSIFSDLMMESGTLSQVKMDLDLDGKNWLFLRSETGRFERKNHRLRVGSPFVLYTSLGYQIHGQSASIDLNLGQVIVQGEVEGWGPLGEITAAAMDAKHNGAYVRFYGGVRAVFYPNKGKEQ